MTEVSSIEQLAVGICREAASIEIESERYFGLIRVAGYGCGADSWF